MKRILGRILLLLLFAASVALAVVVWRAGDPKYRFNEVLAMGRYHEHDELIAQAATKYGVDPMLVKAVVWKESRFSPNKMGGAGERGLMQVGEAAGKEWAKANNVEVFVLTDLFDAKTNLEAGTWYLARAMDRWKETDEPVVFALAEYNAGRSRVEKWNEGRGNSTALMVNAAGVHHYVDGVLRRYHHYRRDGW